MDPFLTPLPFTGRLPIDIIVSAPHADFITARAAGATRYMPPEPCRHGHYSDRFASTKQCVECAAKYRRRSTRIAPPPPAPPLPLPKCLLSLSELRRNCAECPRSGTCRGELRGDVLARAAYAFPTWPTYPRKQALQAGHSVYMPPHPCRQCGRVAWRRMRDSACSGCHFPKAYGPK